MLQQRPMDWTHWLCFKDMFGVSVTVMEESESEWFPLAFQVTLSFITIRDRQTDSFKLGHEPTHPPTLFQAGSASASPTSQRLTGITSAHHGYGKSTTPHPLSPGDPLRLSYSVGTLGVRMCITERLEKDVLEEPHAPA